jgi:hypothetical protein
MPFLGLMNFCRDEAGSPMDLPIHMLTPPESLEIQVYQMCEGPAGKEIVLHIVYQSL